MGLQQTVSPPWDSHGEKQLNKQQESKRCFFKCVKKLLLLHNREAYGSPGEELHLVNMRGWMVAQHTLQNLAGLSLHPQFQPPVQSLSDSCYPAESGKKLLNRIAVPIAAVCKAALGVHGNFCAVQGCSVLSRVLLAAPHSDCSGIKLCCSLCKKSGKKWVEREGQCALLYKLPVCRRATASDMIGFLLHFPFFVFQAKIVFLAILLLPDFSLFISFHLLSPLFHCACMSLYPLFVFSFSLFSLIILPLLNHLSSSCF